nr:MAE [Schizochytrium sp.]
MSVLLDTMGIFSRKSKAADSKPAEATLALKDSSRGAEESNVERLRNPHFNKGTSFTQEERAQYGVLGLVPSVEESMELQTKRELQHLRRKTSDIEKYEFLMGLLDRNVQLFYKLVTENISECMPLVYTPTVGQACQEFHLIYTQPRGLYVSLNDLGNVQALVDNWPEDNVTTIVMTDGGRILGLGDLGANGLGIPQGKLQLYSACAGIPHHQCLPVILDVGTNNESLLEDELYMGLRQKRERGETYDHLVKEFMQAAQKRWGRSLLIQFEDFDNTNAFRLLEETRHSYTTFNDDIQGTAAVSLAGVLASLRVTSEVDGGKNKLRDHTFVFLGAGEAGTGIANLIAHAIQEEAVDDGEEPISEAEARRKIWLVDSKGLVTKTRNDNGELQHHKIDFAHEITDDLIEAVKGTEFEVKDGRVTSLEQAVHMLKPSALIGVSAIPRTFTQSIVEYMAEINEVPLIFALSNPTSQAECTAEQAYNWSSGRAIFVSGSPFDPVDVELESGEVVTKYPGQGNNAYIFPGLGLGVLAAKATTIPNELLYVSAQALAEQVVDEDLDGGRMYPHLSHIREVSAKIGVRVADRAFKLAIASAKRPEDLDAYVRSCMAKPIYPQTRL